MLLYRVLNQYILCRQLVATLNNNLFKGSLCKISAKVSHDAIAPRREQPTSSAVQVSISGPQGSVQRRSAPVGSTRQILEYRVFNQVDVLCAYNFC